MSYEPQVGLVFMRAALLANASIAAAVGDRVSAWEEWARTGRGDPSIVISFVNGRDVRVIGGVRVWTNCLYQVEWWARTRVPATVASGAALIDQVLDGAAGVVSGQGAGDGTVVATNRESPLFLPPDVDGEVVWMRAGGEYRLYIQGA
jgi:hypothetical protein